MKTLWIQRDVHVLNRTLVSRWPKHPAALVLYNFGPLPAPFQQRGYQDCSWVAWQIRVQPKWQWQWPACANEKGTGRRYTLEKATEMSWQTLSNITIAHTAVAFQDAGTCAANELQMNQLFLSKLTVAFGPSDETWTSLDGILDELWKRGGVFWHPIVKGKVWLCLKNCVGLHIPKAHTMCGVLYPTALPKRQSFKSYLRRGVN